VAPLETMVQVRGHMETDERGEVLVATHVVTRPIPDFDYSDDPTLPRVLSIGDSISIGYHRDLVMALEGRANVHRPGENCRNTRWGVARIDAWLGPWEEPGRGWDVIAFNFGHWNARGVGPEEQARFERQYQADLETLIAAMQQTGAALVWVTTAPVPAGRRGAGLARIQGKSATLNAWAAEVMARHPDIAVVDLWQLVEDDPRYAEWRKGTNVHFPRALDPPLAEAVASGILEQLARRAEDSA
jgi:acyl-CoA thioesterase-1